MLEEIGKNKQRSSNIGHLISFTKIYFVKEYLAIWGLMSTDICVYIYIYIYVLYIKYNKWCIYYHIYYVYVYYIYNVIIYIDIYNIIIYINT